MKKREPNRIVRCFESLRLKGKKAFIPYIAAGDPDLKTTEEMVIRLEQSGADIVELGIPFSDPMADGKTIQGAIQRALSSGTTPSKVFNMVQKLRKRTEIPIVFMTYYNIVFQRGLEKFASDAVACGADGVIVPDLPAEEAGSFAEACRDRSLALIMLAAPTTTEERFKKLSELTAGFIYYVSLTGVTGERTKLSNRLRPRIKQLKKITDKPLCVGFGLSTAEHVKEISLCADGAIVGSALVSLMETCSSRKEMLDRVSALAREMALAAHGED